MKPIKFMIMFSILLIFLVYKNEGANKRDTVDFSPLNGNKFILKIDKDLRKRPIRVQFPRDELKNDDYEKINNGATYDISFSANGKKITVEPENLIFTKDITNKTEGNETQIYDILDHDLPGGSARGGAGGRFIVRINNERFEAELTFYGSGVPIIGSERGYLVPQ